VANGGQQHATREGYARLPEDLLRDLLDGVPAVVEKAKELLGSSLDRKDELREALEQLGLVKTYNSVETASVCGVDGGYAVERTAACDLVLSVAVGVEGHSATTTDWDGTQYEWWSDVDKHDLEAERLARGVMVAQELAILAGAPHQWRILDGSHLTPVIQLNSALTTISDAVGVKARKVWADLKTVEALGFMASDQRVIAMPKYDSSRTIVDQLEVQLGEEVNGDDKLVLGLLLKPGELIVPQRMPNHPWQTLHIAERKKEDKEIATAMQAAIKPLTDRHLAYTYFKPDEYSPAFRLELKEGFSDAQLDEACSTIAAQMTGPFVREPYPQYLADVMAKSVGLGLYALQTATQLALSGLGRSEIAEMLVHSYRTEGV
jgi:hypothetical protein